MAQLTQHPTAFPGGTSEVWTTPYPLTPGAIGYDKDGNAYLYVEYTAPVCRGVAVIINDVNQASPLQAASVGRVGIVHKGTTSDHAGWVQIYGLCRFVQTALASDTSASNLGYEPIVPAGITTPDGLIIASSASSANAIHIEGAWFPDWDTVSPEHDTNSVATDSSGPSTYVSAVTAGGTSDRSGQTMVLFLNFPYVTGITEQRQGSA